MSLNATEIGFDAGRFEKVLLLSCLPRKGAPIGRVMV